MDCLLNHPECKYKLSFYNNRIPALIIDPENGHIDDANFAACDYYGYTMNDILLKNIYDINILNKEDIKKEMARARKDDRNFFRFKHRLSSGEIRDVEVHSGALKIEGKEWLFSIIHDMEEKLQLEKDYSMQKTFFTNLFDNSPEAIAIVDKDFLVQDINESFISIFQYELGDVMGKDLTEVLCEKSEHDVSHNFRETILRGRFVREEARRKRKDGSLVDVLLLGLPLVIDGETIGAYTIYSDISEVKEKEDQIRNLSTRDSLTNLYNRYYIINKVEDEISKHKYGKNFEEKFGLLVLGINEFEEIYDALGHRVGDYILKEFSKSLKVNLRDEDIAARFLKDEFVVLIPKINNLGQLRAIVARIINNSGKTISVDKNTFQLTASAGISVYPEDGEDVATLIRRAEIAMKESKRNRAPSAIEFQDKLDEEIQEQFWIRNELAKAIFKGDLFLNYQPIYRTETNELIGVEALLRWKHRERGMIPPLSFIPIAEKTGLISEIGKWVLLNACRQNMEWQNQGYKPILISVNVSVLQMEEVNFINTVKGILKETGLDPKYLQLEITETLFIQNSKLVKSTLRTLGDMGIKIAIDDFGTGYSSLGELSELNINNLKIDRVFIDGLEKNINKSKIVKAIIAMGESLGMSLTAEGVETKDQLKFLRDNKCNMVQGYYFHKPMAARNIGQLIEAK